MSSKRFATVEAAEEYIDAIQDIQKQINFAVCHLARYALECIQDGDLEKAKVKLNGILSSLEHP